MTSSLDHDCEKRGCAKVGLDPKLHIFDECFGGNIRMGDVDAAVERNGYILWMEWKRVWSDQHTFAQVLMFKAFSGNSRKQIAVCVVGDPKEMTVEKIRILRAGKWESDWIPSSIDDLKRRFKAWYVAADAAPRMRQSA